MNFSSNPVALVILDGFGYRIEREYNAIAAAHTPHFDYLWQHYPHTLLKASGCSVGLLPDMVGNSEVGHMTIGTGRVIEQPHTKITKSIHDRSFFDNVTLNATLKKLPVGSSIHLIGLLSDGGVHSDISHAIALLEAIKRLGFKQVFLHPFLDGRDVAPRSASLYLKALDQARLSLKVGQIGSLQGRFYAMDRDNNWDRTQQCYNVLTHPQLITFSSWSEALDSYYEQGLSDEFIPPTQLLQKSIIKDKDGIIFFNFRPDRARQLTTAFTQKSFNYFKRPQLKLSFFLTMTDFGLPNSSILSLFPSTPVINTLKQCLTNAGKTIFSIAETEKYAHITYFFEGGNEDTFSLEEQVLVPSLSTKDYIDHPQMSAPLITEKVVRSLEKKPRDFYLINYANADMVGHSGNFNATIKAIECLDTQLNELYKAFVIEHNGILIITADHGKAEEMYDSTLNQPKTSHAPNLVPFIEVSKKQRNSVEDIAKLRQLADIAPFILHQFKIPIPQEMKL